MVVSMTHVPPDLNSEFPALADYCSSANGFLLCINIKDFLSF